MFRAQLLRSVAKKVPVRSMGGHGGHGSHGHYDHGLPKWIQALEEAPRAQVISAWVAGSLVLSGLCWSILMSRGTLVAAEAVGLFCCCFLLFFSFALFSFCVCVSSHGRWQRVLALSFVFSFGRRVWLLDSVPLTGYAFHACLFLPPPPPRRARAHAVGRLEERQQGAYHFFVLY